MHHALTLYISGQLLPHGPRASRVARLGPRAHLGRVRQYVPEWRHSCAGDDRCDAKAFTKIIIKTMVSDS